MKSRRRGYAIYFVASGAAFFISAAVFFMHGGYAILRIRDENLQKFYLLEKQDPLIAGYPVDANRLEGAIKFFGAVEKSNIELAIANDQIFRQGADGDGVEERAQFLPMRFLETLPEVQRRYTEFMARPSRRNAIDLLSAQEASANFYRDDAVMLGNNWRWLASLYGISLDTFDTLYIPLTQLTITTPGIILDDLELVAKNGEELLREASARRECLLDGICAAPTQVDWGMKAEVSRVPLLAERMLFPSGGDILDKRGPYFVPTTCFGFGANGLPIERPFYLVDRRWSNLPDFISIKLATDIYYTKLDPAREKNPLLKEYIDAGIEWYAHGEAPYRCTDLSYVFRLTTLDWLVSELKKSGGIFSGRDIGSGSIALQEARRLEQSLVESAQPQYQDARKLGELYQGILAENSIIPEDIRKRLEDTVLALRTEYADLDRILTMLTSYLVGLDDDMRVASAGIDVHYLFVSRMHTSLVFLIHSPSIWRLQERPVLVRRPPPDFVPDPRIKTFTEIIRSVPAEALLSQTIRKGQISFDRIERATARFTGKN